MKKTGVDKQCLICGSTFYVPGWRLKDKTRGKYCSNECANKAREGICYSKPPIKIGEFNNKWKGDKVGYSPLHRWVRRWLGKPKNCSSCGSEENLVWSNISRKYKRDLSDWQPLCQKCNLGYDKGFYGSIRRKYANSVL
jgi:hypothetical protein